MAKKRRRKNGASPAREWLSDNLRYILLVLGVLAVLVALFILHVAWEIAYPALQELVDAEIGGKSAAVEALARNVAGVVEVHKVRVRRYGGAYVADLHVHVDAGLSVAEGHGIGHDVSDALLASDLGIVDAVVHVEPAKSARTIALPS